MDSLERQMELKWEEKDKVADLNEANRNLMAELEEKEGDLAAERAKRETLSALVRVLNHHVPPSCQGLYWALHHAGLTELYLHTVN